MQLPAAISIILVSVFLNFAASLAIELRDDTSTQSTIADEFLWAYLTESLEGNSTPIIIEESIDQRVSNLNFIHHREFIVDKNINQFKSSNRDVIDEYERFVNGPEVDQTKCTEHLQQMVDLLEDLETINEGWRKNRSANALELHQSAPRIDGRHIRLAKVLDSYGRYSSAMLEGNQDILGMQVECLETKLQFDANRPDDLVGTRSCLAKLDMRQQLSPKLRYYPTNYITAVNVEICIPNTCHATSLAANKHLIQKLIDSQFVMPKSLYVHQHREVIDLFCVNDRNESIGIPTNGKVLLALMSCWVVVMVITTLRDDKSSVLDRYFNIRRSIDGLIDDGGQNQRDGIDYDALSAVRFLGTYLIVFAHTLLIFASFTRDIGRMKSLLESYAVQTTYAPLVLFVNTFFMMSGMLTAHIALRQIQKLRGPLSVPAQIVICLRIIVARYLRIMPVYFFVYWFKRSVYLYNLSGLGIDRGYNENTWYGSCRTESWLTPVLAQAPFLPLSRQCMQQAWTLGCDVFFIVVGAPLIVIMSQRPKIGLSLTALLTAASIWSQYSDFAAIDPYKVIHLKKFFSNIVLYKLNPHSTVYTSSQNRISTFLVALICGYFLHRSDWQKSKPWPEWFSKRATRWSTFLLIAPIVVGLIHEQLFEIVPFNLKFLLWTIVMCQIVWPVANAIIFARMMTDWKSNYIMQLLSGNFWRTMSKLGLGILLVHNDLIYRAITTSASLPYSDTTFNFGSIYLNSTMLSLVIYLVFGWPLEKMVKDSMQFVDKLLAPSRPADCASTKLVKTD